MATVPIPVIMDFKKDQMANYKEVKHFNLIKGSNLFSEKLNIAINRGFSQAKYEYSLKIRQGKRWSKQITGMFSTAMAGVYFGDTNDKSNLILFQFFNEDLMLRLHYFPNFYTRRISEFIEAYFKRV